MPPENIMVNTMRALKSLRPRSSLRERGYASSVVIKRLIAVPTTVIKTELQKLVKMIPDDRIYRYESNEG